jgi:DNA-directed RNA polymerase subunit beta'
VIYFTSFIITDVNVEALEQTKEQVKAEYKAKKKMIEGERKRDLGRVEEKDDLDANAKKDEIKRIEEMADQKLEELEEEFLKVDSDLKELKVMKIIPETTYHEWSIKFGHIFDAGIGADAILRLLQRLNIEATVTQLEEDYEATRSKTKRDRIMRRLKLLRSLDKNKVDPTWMILRAIPVIPSDLRPMVPLDGGRFATSDLNDLYRRVINRNNRLKRLYDLNAPEVITRNEKRMLQEAVDALIDNSARASKTVIAAGGKKRQLKSLADFLKGKQGRFRQNLLGKRIDYSGRSVIVVGPHLDIDQCGLPKKMALELFRPFVISKLIDREYVHNIRSANRFIEGDRPEVWDILEEVTADAFVLLNRAPTLHRLGIQAFRPVLIEGKAIQVHPLVCDAYNADFDGDQMAVHVPLTEEAKREARDIMLSIRNLLKPAHGGPVTTPGKDIAWAMFYLTMTLDEADEKRMKKFSSKSEAELALHNKVIKLQDWIFVLHEGKVMKTTVGRLIVNELFPDKIEYKNETLGKKGVAAIIRDILEYYGQEFTAGILDDIKDLGFKYAMLSGYSWGMSELPTVEGKTEIIEGGNTKVQEIEGYYAQGLLTQSERQSQIIKVWTEVKNQIEDLSRNTLPAGSSAFTMIESGARGAWGQLTQMIGMIGLKTGASGGIIELPVKSSFKDGVDVLEFFISSHGIRKGLTDTALRTASAGYLTRRLVDVAQDIVVTQTDCGDNKGVVLTHDESEEIGEPLLIRILGRYTLSEIRHPDTGDVLIKKNTLITEDHVRALKAAEKPLSEAHVRSVMTCNVRRGVCQKCYGYDLAHNKIVKPGTSVGIMAAQSIGEPGTQLTMRTFHTGGVAGKDITQGLPRVEELFEARIPKRKAIMTEVSGKVQIETAEREIQQVGTGKLMKDTRPGQKIVRVKYQAEDEVKVPVGRGGSLEVKEGDKVKKGDVIGTTSDGAKVKAEADGAVLSTTKTIATILQEADKVREYIIPQGYDLYVKDGDEVLAGDVLTEGHIDLQALFKHKGKDAVQRYLSKEIQGIYSSQGQKLNNKHIEIIVRQMFSRVKIVDPGDTRFLSGEVVEKGVMLEEHDGLEKGKKPAEFEELFLGITKVSLSTESWLSSASFQQTASVLINAAVTGRVDQLTGLKENVIIGRLIPSGTGFAEDYIDMTDLEAGETFEQLDKEEEKDVEQASEMDKAETEEAPSEAEEAPAEEASEEKEESAE